jgi:hypothetical protein
MEYAYPKLCQFLHKQYKSTQLPAGNHRKKYENLCDILRVLCENNILVT